MDKQTTIGFVLLGAILIGWQFYNQPTEEQIAEMRQQDSLALVEQSAAVDQQVEEMSAVSYQDTAAVLVDSAEIAQKDSLLKAENISLYGAMAKAAEGEDENFSIETNKFNIQFESKGGGLSYLALKDEVTYYHEPVVLIDNEHFEMNTSLSVDNRNISLSDLYFYPVESASKVEGDTLAYVMRAQGNQPSQYIDLVYHFTNEDYLFNVDIVPHGVNVGNDYKINWNVVGIKKEKDAEAERKISTAYYRYMDENPDYLSEAGDESSSLEQTTQWVSFKQQFFTVVLGSDKGFKPGSSLAVASFEDDTLKTREVNAELNGAFENGKASFFMYAGTMKYSTLNQYDYKFNKQVNLGWGIFRWINQLVFIPLFNLLSGLPWSIGYTIILMTFIVKGALFPITYKTYMSGARQRVLKPEIEELNKKFGGEGQEMQKQQAVMALYREAGVNPMAGCIPQLIQFPILIALFRFFPSAFELRQQPFWWADDLSTYDSIMPLPFDIPMYGSHVSLFTLLMAISMFAYTKYNMSNQVMVGAQAQQMKIMTYMSPFMMLVFFNSYSAGLSLYYLTSNLVTIGQQFAIRKWFVDEDKIHAELQENKKKPKKKSRFAAAMENMQEQQDAQNRKMRRQK